MADFLKLFRSQASVLKSDIISLRKELDAKRRRREELLTAPLPESDLAQILCEYVDLQAARFPNLVANRLGYIRGDRVLEGNPLQGARDPAWILFPGEGQQGGLTSHAAIALAYVLREPFKKAICAALAEAGLVGGPTRASRIAELPRLEADIKELETRNGELEKELEGMRRDLAV